MSAHHVAGGPEHVCTLASSRSAERALAYNAALSSEVAMSEVEAKVGSRRRASGAAGRPHGAITGQYPPRAPGHDGRPLQAAVRRRRAAHPPRRARRTREHRPRRRHPERHRVHDQGGRDAHAPRAGCIFPRALVEDTVANARRGTSCCTARTRSTTWSPGVRACISAPPARRCTSSMPRPATYRDSTTKDLYDIARVVDTLEHLHFYQRSVVCRDLVATARRWTSTRRTPACRARPSTSGTSWVQPRACSRRASRCCI